MMRIAFLTTSHIPEDDRMFYHMAVTLVEYGYKVNILSSYYLKNGESARVNFNSFNGAGLSKKEKLNRFSEELSIINPDVIICLEPLPVYTAKSFKSRSSKKIIIVYDITEWYPSKKNLAGTKLLKKVFTGIKLFLFNYFVASKSEAFIFGEYYKSMLYRRLFPRKPFLYLSYYPNLDYINYKEPDLKKNQLRLSYSGKLSREKGLKNFFDVAELLLRKRQELNIKIKLIGSYPDENERSYFENNISRLQKEITIEFFPFLPLQKYIETINDTDIFLDLRSNDFENRHCLPIKIFYYAALKRPVIYSDLKAIKKEVDIRHFGYLVRPTDKEKITGIILNYINDGKLYEKHSVNARRLAEDKYNWHLIKTDFVNFLRTLYDR